MIHAWHAWFLFWEVVVVSDEVVVVGLVLGWFSWWAFEQC